MFQNINAFQTFPTKEIKILGHSVTTNRLLPFLVISAHMCMHILTFTSIYTFTCTYRYINIHKYMYPRNRVCVPT